MKNDDLTTKNWLAHGWSTYKNNLKLMVLGAMIFYSFSLFIALFAHLPFGRYLTFVFQLVVDPVLATGWWFFCLKLARGQPAGLLDIFGAFRNFAKVWATFFLVTVILLIGFVLFLIPGIICTLKYGLSIFIVMDKGLAPHKAIAYSGLITKGFKVKLFGLLLTGFLAAPLTWPFAFGLQNIGSSKGNFYMMVGIIPYFVGLLVVIPWVNAAWATAYDVLSKRYEQVNTWRKCK
ncbi:MAG: hypothetical protein ACYSSL_04840 [Planctomycetota bacterium]|jgi:UPF0716 family protein affecting phage T7 exclusion